MHNQRAWIAFHVHFRALAVDPDYDTLRVRLTWVGMPQLLQT